MRILGRELRWTQLELKLESSLCKAAYRIGNMKPSSAPYLSGDTFRSLCRHFYEPDGDKAFDEQAVQEGDLVFCESWRLAEFLSGPARRIEKTFTIIGHNGYDFTVDDRIERLLPSTVYRLFAQNAIVASDRVIGLPIGLENKRLHYNGITRDFDGLRQKMPRKKPRILSAFAVGNNPGARQEAVIALSRSPCNDTLPLVDSRSYRKIAAEYMFIASPPGNGVDCHRTWEAMYLRSVPVVLRSPLTDGFKSLGLPLMVVDSYRDIVALKEADLAEIYETMSPLMDSEALWAPYWERRTRELERLK